MKKKELIYIEDKGCITFSRVCVDLGKVADLETAQEKYYCVREFPEDCSEFGCPKLMPMQNQQVWKLRKLSKREVRMLRR